MSIKNNITTGKRETMRAILDGTISKIYLALDADEPFKQEFVDICNIHSVEMEYVQSKEGLGRKIEIEVPCGVVGVLFQEETKPLKS